MKRDNKNGVAKEVFVKLKKCLFTGKTRAVITPSMEGHNRDHRVMHKKYFICLRYLRLGCGEVTRHLAMA